MKQDPLGWKVMNVRRVTKPLKCSWSYEASQDPFGNLPVLCAERDKTP
jgi:hypothetical protein